MHARIKKLHILCSQTHKLVVTGDIDIESYTLLIINRTEFNITNEEVDVVVIRQ